MLEESRKNWYKQRYTAKRIYELLKERHPAFEASYSTLGHYIAGRRKHLCSGTEEAFNRLIWHAGEAQADFGEAFHQERSDGKVQVFRAVVPVLEQGILPDIRR